VAALKKARADVRPLPSALRPQAILDVAADPGRRRHALFIGEPPGSLLYGSLMTLLANIMIGLDSLLKRLTRRRRFL
jgi:hypothetical protein